MQFRELVEKQRHFLKSQKMADLDFRKELLKKLATHLKEAELSFFEALKLDLGKPELESLVSETGAVLEEIKLVLKHIDSWARPQKVSTPIMAQPGSSTLYPEAKGAVLVISPWNYPLSLSLMPVIGAIAAGNTVILKPSEFSKATTKLLGEFIREHFSEEVLACVEGDDSVAKELLKERFDHIFFTGSTATGRKILQAAAEHLTPVTLELGGKSPCIVDSTASLELAAKRIVWGKFFNAGQTCIAPDYVLVHSSVYDRFLNKLKKKVAEEFGEDASYSPDYARIINERHFDRLMHYMSDGRIICGGAANKESRYIAPTVLTEVSLEAPIMEEEIFGPLLPVISYSSFEELKEIISSRRNPLALYVFSEDRDFEQKVIAEIPFGGGCVNDTLMHFACHSLPFGGRGESGMGAYHGKASFDVFTHYKSVLDKSTLFDPPLRYRPYEKRISTVRWVVD